MGFIDKIKTILFDEEVVEETDQLPDMSSKKAKKGQTGFIDHGSDEDDENLIVELVVPKDEPKEEVKEEKVAESYLEDYKTSFGNEFEEDIRDSYKREEEKPKVDNFDQFDSFDTESDVIPTRSRNYDDLELSFMEEKEDKAIEVKSSFHRVTEPTKEKKEIKDYRKMLSDESKTDTEKKPFKNTPVISPVWGILDKNYTPDEIAGKAEDLNKINSGVVPRTYGPVSYNDQPLPSTQLKVTEDETPTKEDLAEINETISEMTYEDEVEIMDKQKEEEIKHEEEVRAYEEAIVKEITPTVSYEDEEEVELPQRSIKDFDDEEDAIISTDDYDSYEEIKTDDYDSYEDINGESVPTHSIDDLDSGIEEENTTQNNINDPFESDDYKTFDDDEDNVVDFDSIVHKKKYDDEDEGLDNTIETDLFNLIDSMYKSEEDN